MLSMIQLSIVLMIALLEHFNFKVNKKFLFEVEIQSLEYFFNKHFAGATTSRNMQTFTV